MARKSKFLAELSKNAAPAPHTSVTHASPMAVRFHPIDSRRPKPAFFVRCCVNETTDDGRWESRVAAAYVQLALSCAAQDGARSVRIARVGRLDLRLVEPARPASVDDPLFWLELYDNDAEMTIDSCGCDDLQDAAKAAEQLIREARDLINAAPAITRRTTP
jgi:hypothetical protein